MDAPKKATLEDLMTFPAELVLRVMGETSDSLADRCTATLVQTLDRAPLDVSVQPSSKGNYLSVRLKVRVDTADEVREASAALRGVPGVRLVL